MGFQTFDTTLVSPKVRHVLFPVYLRSSRWKVLLPRPAREQAKSSCSNTLIHVLHVRPFLCKRSAFCRFRDDYFKTFLRQKRWHRVLDPSKDPRNFYTLPPIPADLSVAPATSSVTPVSTRSTATQASLPDRYAIVLVKHR